MEMVQVVVSDKEAAKGRSARCIEVEGEGFQVGKDWEIRLNKGIKERGEVDCPSVFRDGEGLEGRGKGAKEGLEGERRFCLRGDKTT